MADFKGDDEVAAAADAVADVKLEEEKAPEFPQFPWLPPGKKPLADGEYDCIVMGTGLKECVLSGLLATAGKKVLHVDRNSYYGADSASLNLSNLFAKFNNGKQPEQRIFDVLGQNRDYNVDLIPKCIMACGKLVKMLIHTKVTRYLEFRSLDASYVYRNGKIYKVPATKMEVVSNGLLGLFEKRRMINFLMYLQSYDEKKPETHKGRDLTRMTMRQLYDEYGLEKGTREFVGHAMALQLNDDYMDQPALSTVKAIIMYCYSVDRYGKSPYVYPMYGLGGLPEGFSRLCAIHGGTFMLNRSVDEVLFDNEGKAWGIRGDDEIAKAKIFIGDPSYFQPYQKCREIGKVVRSICFLNHPIPNTNDVDSLQIIIPSTQLNRKNDIYVVLISNSHQVTAAGKYVAICSTVVETSEPMRELAPALGLLGTIMTRFDDVVPLYEPLADGRADQCINQIAAARLRNCYHHGLHAIDATSARRRGGVVLTDRFSHGRVAENSLVDLCTGADNCYISKSFDATSHFETTSLDVIDMYERITGEKLDLDKMADSAPDEDGY